MYDSEDDLRALLGVEAESVSLDFKDGIKLNNMTNDARKELVVDVTAMANSGGGTIIYGIAEQQLDGRSLAGTISPVTDDRVTQDRLREIVYSNTDPAFSDFTIKCIPVAQGNVFVVEVAEGDTAFQNKMDRRYYNRVDASSVPMYGYAIRDVMNRRTTPRLSCRFTRQIVERTQNRHEYIFVPELVNEGNLTANHWTLHLAIPSEIGRLRNDVNAAPRQLYERTVGNHRAFYFEFSSERPIPGQSARLLPGESRQLGMGQGYGQLVLEIATEAQIRSVATAPSIYWSLFVDNAARQDGEVPYLRWCDW
jgi:hypothetical protein